MKLHILLISTLILTFSTDLVAIEKIQITGSKILGGQFYLVEDVPQYENDGGGTFGPSAGSGSASGDANPFKAYGCQECQSKKALFSCTVSVNKPLVQDQVQTLKKLQREDCCASEGGAILTTKWGSCPKSNKI